MDTTIKQIAIDHDDLIEQIVLMTHRFSFESHIYEQLGFDPDKFRDYLKVHMQAPAAVYAAMRGDTVMGYAIFFIDTAYINQPNFEIVTIYVAPEFRKTNAGRTLAEALVETMDINGCKYGQVSICCAMKHNEDLINMLTQNMFKKLGFYQIGTIMGRRGLSWESAH
jgi:ribosomal protein S18 acetylase RimI-like enzyme